MRPTPTRPATLAPPALAAWDSRALPAEAARGEAQTGDEALTAAANSAATTSIPGSEPAGFWSDAPRWLLLAVLIYAPWAYGCTRPWTLEVLNGALFLLLGAWLANCLATRRVPRVPKILAVATGLLLLQGWWMTLNSAFIYDDSFVAHPRPNWIPGAPGAVDFKEALPTTVGLSAMLGLICFACDLSASRRWRRRVWITMAIAGTSVILLGLAQKIYEAPGIFWQEEGHAPTFFGPFRYHANAGSFINLVWPLAAALLARSVRREEPWWLRLSWGGCLIIAVSGALANTSRASGLITVAWLAGWTFWSLSRQWRQRAGGNPAATFGVALALAAVLIGLLAAGGLDATMRRWEDIGREITPDNSRWMVVRVCLEMLPQSGWLGFGPGAFKTAFPFFNKDTSLATEGVWLHAHQDYLQTLVEWGWCGGTLWAVVVLGGLGLAGTRLARRRLAHHDRVLPLAAGAAVLAVLVHAMVDFPLQIASIQAYVAVLVGLLWSAGRWPQLEQPSDPAAAPARRRDRHNGHNSPNDRERQFLHRPPPGRELSA